MSYKNIGKKSEGAKITQQIITAQNLTTKKWQKLWGRKPVILNSDGENPT